MATALLTASLTWAQLAPNTASAQEIETKAPTVRVTLAPGHAKLVVRRKWHNPGKRSLLTDSFDVPDGGVLGNLKANLSRGWVHPRLLPSDAAKKLFDGQGALGGHGFLLTGSRSNHFSLTLTPFAAASTTTIEYTATVPTLYTQGRHVLFNPGHVTALAGAGNVLIDGVNAAVHRRKTSKTGVIEGTELQLATSSRRPLHGALAFVKLSEKRRALRYRLHAASKLSRAPKNASVVIVLDGSRSMSQRQADGMVAAARAYLSHLEDAKVDVVVFDRHATSVFGKLVKANRASAALSTMSIAQRNGSDVKAALTLASDRLADAPKSSPKRVVLFTDALTKSTLDAGDLGLASVGGLLHVAIPSEASYGVKRNDLHAWARHVAKTGGVVWRAPARPSADLTDLAEHLEELVRPMRVHHAKLRVPAAENLEHVSSELKEGEGLTGLSLAEDLDPRVRFSGVLWQKPVDITLNPSLHETRLWEGLVLGSSIAPELTADEVRRLGMKARVVTDETSFVHATAGRRQLFGGLGLRGIGSSACGGCRGYRSPKARLAFPDPEGWLGGRLANAHSACAGGMQAVTVRIETTKDEIVDVHVKTGDAKLAACMEARTWKILLPADFSSRAPRGHFEVTLPR